MQKEEFIKLAEKVIDGMATEEENQRYVTLLDNLTVIPGGWDEGVLGKKEELESAIKEAIEVKIKTKQPVRMHRQKWVAAASIILVLTLSYFVFFNKPSNKDEIVKVPEKDVEAPKASKAMITLADGRQISLDSLTTLDQNNVLLTKTPDGILVYKGAATTAVYNTLTNPKSKKKGIIAELRNQKSNLW